ncbi:MAG TPA: putative sugar nucleotidyl transferase, partial [Phycisphaerae bacterium]|nr:putative sugar nucleotidyl transferase [Phycisphaerae bacterium]
MKLVIFEDDQFDRFLPLAYVRGVFELRCGATTLAAKIERTAGRPADALLVRDYLAMVVKGRYGSAAVNDLGKLAGDEVLFVNARVCGTGLKLPDRGTAAWKDGQLAAWRTGGNVSGIKSYADLAVAAKADKTVDFAGTFFAWIWDLMLAGPEQITADFKAVGRSGIEGKMHESSVIYGPKDQVFIGPGAEIHPFVCIDTQHGPVTLEAGVEVHPFTRIEGPCCVGAKSILLGAKVREGCSIGTMCRVGGEVEESIIHGYSNKYHDGFLGHAYVGEWVNLGALTTNSDLKNDYTTVSVKMGNTTIDTGSPKVGSFIGDHVKTSIGTLLNTGTVIGTMAVCVATGQPLPKSIPAFGWFVNGFISKGFGLGALMQTARIAMSRRKVTMTEQDEQLLRTVYELTKDERLAA